VVERGKWDIVVEAFVVGQRGLLVLMRRLTLLAAALVVRPSAKQLQGSVDVDVHLCGVPLDAVLLPIAGFQLALDVALGPFAQVLAGNLSDI